MTWQDKAHGIIQMAAFLEYRAANYRRGIKLRRHVPYRLPEWVEDLDAIARNNEEEGKRLMLSYDAMKIRKEAM